MSTEHMIDYEVILADLEAKRAVLDTIINGLRQLVGAGGVLNLSPTTIPTTPMPDSGDIDAGTFFNMSIPDAARKYLGMTKRKQTTRQIAEALQRGGIHSTAKNFNTMLYSIMDRQDDIVRVGKEWGMAAWYPSMKGKGKRGKGGAEKIEGQKGDDDKEDEHAAA